MRNEQSAVLHFKHCWLFFDFRDCSVHSSVLVLVKLFPKVPDPGAAPTLVVNEGGLKSETDITKDPKRFKVHSTICPSKLSRLSKRTGCSGDDAVTIDSSLLMSAFINTFWIVTFEVFISESMMGAQEPSTQGSRKTGLGKAPSQLGWVDIRHRCEQIRLCPPFHGAVDSFLRGKWTRNNHLRQFTMSVCIGSLTLPVQAFPKHPTPSIEVFVNIFLFFFSSLNELPLFLKTGIKCVNSPQTC